MALAWLARLVDGIAGAAGAPRTETHVVRGIPVVVENTRPDIATADVLKRLDEALGLIERYQPWRFRHLRRDVRRIAVRRFPCRGAFFPDERTCLTELTFLARRDISAAPVASSILHEGMHARVHAMGVDPATKSMAREERLCRRAELEFGQALPPGLGAPVIQRARETMALADQEVAPTIDWQVAAARTHAADDAARRPPNG